jgi:hypothetical protein
MSDGASSMCGWCGKGFTPRSDGGKRQVFCRPVCRRGFDAAGRRWVADAIATGRLTVQELKSGAAPTRALRRSGERLSSSPDTASTENAYPHLLARFLVEVPLSTIESFTRFGFIRSDQTGNLFAILAALRRLGREPVVSRVA